MTRTNRHGFHCSFTQSWITNPWMSRSFYGSKELQLHCTCFLRKFKLGWKFHWNFHCNFFQGYESLIETFSANFQGGMKVWLQTFNQSFKGYASLTAKIQSKFQGVCKFDCKISTKLSMQSKKHQKCSNMLVVFVWNQSNPPRFVQVFPHNNAQMFFLVDQINPPGFAYVVLMRVILRQQSNPTARNQFCFKFENKSWSK